MDERRQKRKEEKENLLSIEDKTKIKEDISENSTNKNDKKSKIDEKPLFIYDAFSESSIFSKLFFYWSYCVLKLSKKIQISHKNLGPLCKENDSAYFEKLIDHFWTQKNYKSIKSNALMKTIMRANAPRLLLIISLLLISSATEYLSVILIKQFIDKFDSTSKTWLNLSMYQLGIIFLLNQLFNIFLSKQAALKQRIISLRAGFELSCFVYKKIMAVSHSGIGERASQGQMINFIQTDTNKLTFMIQRCPNALTGPIMICSYIYLLFRFFGFSFLAGIGVMIFFIFGNYKMFKDYSSIQKNLLKAKDERMKLTTEGFDNIKILKLYNWENDFKNKILQYRETEISHLRKSYNMWTLNISLFWLCPICVSIATIGVYQYFNSKFSIGSMLIGLTIFSKLQVPVRTMPDAINSFLETTVSMKRIEKFIRQQEKDHSLVVKGKYSKNMEYAIKIEHGTFSWGSEKKEIMSQSNTKEQTKEKKLPILKTKPNQVQKGKELQDMSQNSSNLFNCRQILTDISVSIKPGEIVGIIGEVGSGKSSFFHAVLNNLILLNPEECDGIHINGKTAYVSQIPWIQNESIKNNILFFKDFDQEKYNKIIQVTQLQYDLSVFESGENTEIGEKGVNLSGGQKMRIALARALYSDADIFLFDDPISALDANVGKKIMKECIIKYLSNKTRIIATHALHYLKHMDKIIFLNDGMIEWIGSYSDLLHQPFFESLKKLSKLTTRKESVESLSSFKNGVKGNRIVKSEEVKIIAKEDKEIGVVKMSVYLKYILYMGGGCFALSIGLVMLFWQITKGGSDLWLAFWSKKENQVISLGEKSKKWIFFSIYSCLGITSSLFIFLRVFLLTIGLIRLARSLHKKMIDQLMKAPVNLFHETVPRGQIFNRLSKDLDSIQFTFFTVGNLLTRGFSIVGSMIICSIYDYYSLLFVPVLAFLGYLLTNFYLEGSRQLSRIEAISRSPILNVINETIPGRDTIQAYGKEKEYFSKFYETINNSFKINIFSKGAACWFNQQFNMISILYIVYLVVITCFFQEKFSAQSVGIMFTYSIIFEKNLSLFFTASAELENSMISMERCLKYTEVQGEKPSNLPGDEVLAKQKWPQNGCIKFENYSVKYRPNTEIVLKNLTFIINPGEKVGVVGRTGSGKSTICLSLFRLLEPLTGSIYIDDVDISSIGLDYLRQQLTIIPQDPTLLKGTLKYNIDPLGKCTDQEIIAILKKVNFINEKDNDFSQKDILEQNVYENGENFSLGEKQMICIARAIVRKSKIIVMDEATASIDLKTEEKIQKTLWEMMDKTTVITVAHRIKTIIHYDKILVLDNGKLMEFDTPQNLLKNEKSLFYELYSKSVM